jgi:hypothetical protein
MADNVRVSRSMVKEIAQIKRLILHHNKAAEEMESLGKSLMSIFFSSVNTSKACTGSVDCNTFYLCRFASIQYRKAKITMC